MRKLPVVLAGLALAAFALSLLTAVSEVGPGEQAVVRRFGRVVEVRDEPGLYVGLPWGIDRIDRVAVEQVRRVAVGFRAEEDTALLDTPPGQLLTGDHNLVNVQVVLNYSVAPDRDSVVDFVLAQDRLEDILTRLAESVLSGWMSGRNVDTVLLRGKTELPTELVARMQEHLAPYRVGVRLRSVAVATLAPPSQVKAAFDRVAQAQTEIRTGKFQAEQQALRERSAAEAERVRVQEETAAYVTRKERLAQAEATVFELRLAEKRLDPSLVEVNRWEYRQRVLNKLREIQPLDPALGGNGAKK